MKIGGVRGGSTLFGLKWQKMKTCRWCKWNKKSLSCQNIFMRNFKRRVQALIYYLCEYWKWEKFYISITHIFNFYLINLIIIFFEKKFEDRCCAWESNFIWSEMTKNWRYVDVVSGSKRVCRVKTFLWEILKGVFRLLHITYANFENLKIS